MDTYLYEVSVVSVMRVKVEAGSDEDADQAAMQCFLEDFESAGPLRFADLNIDSMGDEEMRSRGGIDRSIIATGGIQYVYAEEEDASAVHAGD